MASLREYFVKDGSRDLTTHQSWPIRNADGVQLGEVIARLHFDFPARAKFVSFYIPEVPGVVAPEAILLNELSKVLEWPDTQVGVRAGFGGEMQDGRDLVFTGQVYLYSERPVPDDLKQLWISEAAKLNHRLTFRSTDYMNERNKWEKPQAFISHDSRDKSAIAQPLALQLQRLMCPVWYDEFSLRVGDGLRQSIERGIRECSKCVLILTANFLGNNGWSKREYDSIFTREIVEKQQVILPVWSGISAKDVYEYSPVLADRVAVDWSLGVEEVARRLFNAINAPG